MSERLARDARLQEALAKAKAAQRSAKHRGAKRKTNRALVRYLGIPLQSTHAVRPEDRYRNRSYSLERQVLGLIDHLLVKYRVPLFLYRSVLSHEGIELVFGERPKRRPWRLPAEARYRDWFLGIAQGASFAKLAKGVLNKREAHIFLSAPAMNSIEDNILWARAAAVGVAIDACDFIVERFTGEDLKLIGSRLPDLLRFFASEWPKMRRNERDGIMDFIRDMIREPKFSFKGRTLGSIRKLSRQWHRTFYSGTIGRFQSWGQLVEPWEMRKGNVVVRAVELTSNRALVDEGQAQCHCVFSYTMRCTQGASRIVSMRWYAVAAEQEQPSHELTRLTLEVIPSHRSVWQIRGKHNRYPTPEEMKASIQMCASLDRPGNPGGLEDEPLAFTC